MIETSELSVIGIDPGKTLGWFRYDELCAYSGEFESISDLPHAGSAVVAIETVKPYSQPLSQDVIDTCIQIGELKRRYPRALLITRGEVKQHLLGRATGSDTDVRRALIDIFGDPGTKKDPGRLYGVKGHGWAALAVAYVVYEQLCGRVGEARRFCDAIAKRQIELPIEVPCK